MIDVGAWLGLVAALLPAALFVKNRRWFLSPRELTNPLVPGTDNPLVPGTDCQLVPGTDCRADNVGREVTVSVLIPARDEAAAIGPAVRSVLASEQVTLELIVLDDHSQDATAAEVLRLAASDRRVRLITGQPLPADWNGKQFACYQLAAAARYDRLLFLDADVRLAPTAIVDLVHYQDASGTPLLSAFPHQETGTWLERWLIPLMHVILLGYLPIDRMRGSRHPAYAAGCGQLFLTVRSAYQSAGTHQAIRWSRHDGLKLPAAYRRAGLATDVVDGTNLASCRMYRSAAEVIRGVLKNADEGIAAPQRIVPFTLLLLGASLWPWVTLVAAFEAGRSSAVLVSLAAITLGHLPRFWAVQRFRQPLDGLLFHTPAIAIFVVLQWVAFFTQRLGRKVAWKGRL